jgi:hypothetical protein
MDHVVYVDANAKELNKLILGTRTMIVRGVMEEEEVPYGRVTPGDTLYFVYSDDRLVCAQATVKDVLSSDRLTHKTSAELLRAYENQLQLTKRETKRWTDRRYLVLIAVENVTPVTPFAIDRSNYGHLDNWLPVAQIQKVIISRQSQWLNGKRYI